MSRTQNATRLKWSGVAISWQQHASVDMPRQVFTAWWHALVKSTDASSANPGDASVRHTRCMDHFDLAARRSAPGATSSDALRCWDPYPSCRPIPASRKESASTGHFQFAQLPSILDSLHPGGYRGPIVHRFHFLASSSGFGYHEDTTAEVEIDRSARVSEHNKEIWK